MSSDDTAALTDRLAAAMRTTIANAVLTNERIARSVGLNVVDLQTFGVLLEAGAPMTAGELSARTGLPTSTTTRVIDRLEHGGFVRREADPGDRRKVLVHPETARMREFEGAYGEILEGLRAAHEGFTAAELEVAARYLEAIADVGTARMGSAGLSSRSTPSSDRIVASSCRSAAMSSSTPSNFSIGRTYSMNRSSIVRP
jgi:DNA-binding MarR family transcriptional regulator